MDWPPSRGFPLPCAQCSQGGLQTCDPDWDGAIIENEGVHGSILLGLLYRLVTAGLYQGVICQHTSSTLTPTKERLMA